MLLQNYFDFSTHVVCVDEEERGDLNIYVKFVESSKLLIYDTFVVQ